MCDDGTITSYNRVLSTGGMLPPPPPPPPPPNSPNLPTSPQTISEKLSSISFGVQNAPESISDYQNFLREHTPDPLYRAVLGSCCLHSTLASPQTKFSIIAVQIIQCKGQDTKYGHVSGLGVAKWALIWNRGAVVDQRLLYYYSLCGAGCSSGPKWSL